MVVALSGWVDAGVAGAGAIARAASSSSRDADEFGVDRPHRAR